MNAAQLLLTQKAVSLSPQKPFRYASGILSPIYCDNRLLLTDPNARRLIADYFVDLIKKQQLQFDVICGIATGAIAWGILVAEQLKKPFIYVRSEKKEHGKERAVEGRLEPGQYVLMIEDLVSTGGSSIKAIENVRQAGGIVTHCVAIFSYGMEKSRNAFTETQCVLYTLTTLHELLEVAVAGNAINHQEKDIVIDWTADTAGWGKKHGFE